MYEFFLGRPYKNCKHGGKLNFHSWYKLYVGLRLVPFPLCIITLLTAACCHSFCAHFFVHLIGRCCVIIVC